MRTALLLAVTAGLAACATHAQDTSPSMPDGSAAVTPEHGGALTFHPERPLAGERVEVTYRPAEALAGEPRLHLRARLRTPEHDDYNSGMGSRTVAIMERGDDGTYRGSLSLPDEVVYAAFAVEDAAASRTDSREGRFWELLVHESNDRPLYSALYQRFNDHMGRDELVVLATAREMARHYPERPQAWSTLRAAEGWVLGEDGVEERLAAYRERLQGFDEKFAEQPDLSSDHVGDMYWMAAGLRHEEIAARWRARLLNEYPGHFFAIQAHVLDLNDQYRENPSTLLSELEALWKIAADRQARDRVVGPGFAAARQAGDAAAILLWAERQVELHPTSREQVASTLAATEATRAEGIRWLQEEVVAAQVATDGHRPLGATITEHQGMASRATAATRSSLGRALLHAGRTEEGIAALERAAAVEWDTGRFRALGEARLSAGDITGATDAFAAVAADPATTLETADSLRLVLELDPTAWDDAIAGTRDEMMARTLASARSELLPPVQVERRDGRPAQLNDLLGADASVVVFWSRHCGFSVQAMPRIAALADRLAEDGVPLLAITRDAPDDAEGYLEEEGFDLQILFDTGGEAARALNSWGTPQYFILDGQGRLRFSFSSLDDLPRQLAALRAGG